MTTGEALKAEGMGKALANVTTPPWKARARQAIIDLALTGREFTSEDVRQRAGDPPTNNVIGAMLNAAARSGVIRRAGYGKADRPAAHARVITRWVAGASAAQAVTAWPTTDTGVSGTVPVPVVSPLRPDPDPDWKCKACGAFVDSPGEPTIDPRWRVGDCPACHERYAYFERRRTP